MEKFLLSLMQDQEPTSTVFTIPLFLVCSDGCTFHPHLYINKQWTIYEKLLVKMQYLPRPQIFYYKSSVFTMWCTVSLTWLYPLPTISIILFKDQQKPHHTLVENFLWGSNFLDVMNMELEITLKADIACVYSLSHTHNLN